MNRRLSILGLFFLVALLFLWEWSSRTNPALALMFPPPSKICESIKQSHSIFFHEALVTIKGMIGGFLVALGLAFSFAIVMDRFKESKSFFQPIFVAFQCLPLFTLAPLIVLWFGWGVQAVIIPNALMIFFLLR
ncbi:MAG: hypothetical protein RR733_04040 [Victivallaceae bacterium]